MFRKDKVKFLPSGDNDDEEDQPSTSVKASRGKAKYAGGLVFEPKRGLWDTYILVMDFNSLYPSIIQEYNIDFTTVEREEEDDVGCEDNQQKESTLITQAEEEKIPDVPETGTQQGVLPRIIATLVNRRRQVKALMKDKSASPAKLMQVCLL